MALEKVESVDQIIVVSNGSVFYRIVEQIVEDGKVLSEVYVRHTLLPGQDVDDTPNTVQAICAAVWTEEVIAAYQALLNADLK